MKTLLQLCIIFNTDDHPYFLKVVYFFFFNWNENNRKIAIERAVFSKQLLKSKARRFILTIFYTYFLFVLNLLNFVFELQN